MIHYLEIPRVREYDAGQIRVLAKNQQGEAESITNLNVIPKEDWRSRLRHAPQGNLIINHVLRIQRNYIYIFYS